MFHINTAARICLYHILKIAASVPQKSVKNRLFARRITTFFHTQ
jgi:hypothetical protein